MQKKSNAKMSKCLQNYLVSRERKRERERKKNGGANLSKNMPICQSDVSLVILVLTKQKILLQVGLKLSFALPLFLALTLTQYPEIIWANFHPRDGGENTSHWSKN